MRTLLPVAALALLASGPSLAEPGERWEMKIELDGSPIPMPMQSVCAPKRDTAEPPVTNDADNRCKILDKKFSGNRFQWKAECPEGTSVGDVTTTADGYHGTVKHTEKGGPTVVMKMSGKKLGPCDYQPYAPQLNPQMSGGKPYPLKKGEMPELTPEMKAQIEEMKKRYGKQ